MLVAAGRTVVRFDHEWRNRAFPFALPQELRRIGTSRHAWKRFEISATFRKLTIFSGSIQSVT
jgi:hypothetical protein